MNIPKVLFLTPKPKKQTVIILKVRSMVNKKNTRTILPFVRAKYGLRFIYQKK